MTKAGLALFVLHETGSASKFSSVLALGFLPMLLLYPFAGALVDSLDRRKLLISLDGVRALCLVGLLVAHSTYPLGMWTAIAYVLFSSVCETLANPAGNTIVPFLFKREHYDLANSANAWALNVASIAAPAVGVWTFSEFGLRGLLLVDALSFGVGAVCSSLLKLIPYQGNLKPQVSYADVKEGLALLGRKELGLPTLAVAFSRAFIDPVYSLVIPFLLVSVLHQSDYGIGVTQAASVIGVIVSPLLVARFRSRHGSLNSLHRSRSGKILVFLVYAICGWVLTTTSMGSRPHVAIAFFGLVCFAGALFNSTGFAFLNAHFQKSVPREFMGRFAASRFMVYAIAQPAGLLLYGLVLDDRWFVVAFAFAALAACAETLLLRTLKNHNELEG